MSDLEVIKFDKDSFDILVTMKDDTVWLTQEQISLLFGRERSNISRHIKNIFDEGELEENTSVQKMPGRGKVNHRTPKYYNLDVIISVGYRVKSKHGVVFRQWATGVLKDNIIKGYSINKKRLEYLEQTIKVLDIASRLDDEMNGDEAVGLIKVLNSYSNSLMMLDNYDHGVIVKNEETYSDKKIVYDECINIINKVKMNEKSDLFALERNRGLESIIHNIYQTFDNKDVYPSIEEKAANLLYLVVKNHVFIDGNKRIAAILFIYILKFYDKLSLENVIISNNTLTALTLLIAQSKSSEKDLIINLVMSFISK